MNLQNSAGWWTGVDPAVSPSVQPLIEASESGIGYSIACVTVFGVAALLRTLA